MTYGSLFTGIGGLDLALEWFGHVPLWQAETDSYARTVLRRHWPEVRCFEDVKEIGDEAPPVDIICGGFPCQDISNAGNRAGIGGERSGLWSEFARIIRVLRPRFVFVENVAALTVRGLDRVLGNLASLGFDAEWEVFRAADVGAPHLRARIFILAYANGEHGGLQPWRRSGASGADPAVATDDGEAELVADSGQVGLRTGIVDLCAWEPNADVSGVGAEATGQRQAQSGGRRSGLERWGYWESEPDVGRVVDGSSSRVDGGRARSGKAAKGNNRAARLRCLGNAVVWQQAAYALETLTGRARRAALNAEAA